ncbi:MAG: radical SAM protein [Coprobacillaceae bacterium]
MKHRSFLIKPASSLCNLACKYCFYCDIAKNRNTYSFGVMKNDVMESLVVQSLSDDVTHVTYAFQGGEPTLSGIQYFYNFIEYVNKTKTEKQIISYAIQTNGYTLDEEWVKLFKENQFLVGISVDGYKENHDRFRPNQKGEGTYQKILDNVKLLKDNSIDYNILTVLTKTLAKHPDKLYRFYKQEGFDHVQLIPCLPEQQHLVNKDPNALTPKLFVSFYNKFYDLWQRDYMKGKYISITLFDNMIPMFKGVAPNQCGMLGICQPQFVIEADGSVYPCDFYTFEKYQLGNIKINTIKELSASKILHSFLHEPRRMSTSCSSCKFQKLCSGNCKALNVCYFDDKGYCGYQEFLEKNYQSMYKIAQSL